MVSSSGAGCPEARIQPLLSVAQLLAAKNALPLRALDQLRADTFGSDDEVAQFLAFTDFERRGD